MKKAISSDYFLFTQKASQLSRCNALWSFTLMYLLELQVSIFVKTIFSTPYRLSYMEWRISYRVEYLLCHDQIQVLCEFFHRRVLLHKKFQNFILGQNLAYLFLVGKAVADAQFAVVKT